MTAKKIKRPRRIPTGAAHKPNDETRAQVQALCGFGCSETMVAEFLKISVVTLRKHYDHERRMARPALMAMANGSLFHHLKNKDWAATRWLHATLGKKYGWTERTEVVFPTDVFANADPSKLSNKEWQLFTDLLLKMGVDLMDTGGAPPRAEPTLIGSSGNP